MHIPAGLPPGPLGAGIQRFSPPLSTAEPMIHSDENPPESPASGPEADDAPPEAGARRSWQSRWPWVVLVSVVLVPALLLGLWTAITMTYTYSSGELPGYIQQFEQRGWICKTWEGELATVRRPGGIPERFAFTVRDDSVAADINRLHGQPVALQYRQHKGVPLSCMGESEYFVHGVRPLDAMPSPGTGAVDTNAAAGVDIGPAGGDTIDPSSRKP